MTFPRILIVLLATAGLAAFASGGKAPVRRYIDSRSALRTRTSLLFPAPF